MRPRPDRDWAGPDDDEFLLAHGAEDPKLGEILAQPKLWRPDRVS